jgi:hypothetical protein
MSDETSLTARDAADASRAVGDLWQALADDDDFLALRVTAEVVHEDLGTDVGFCERLRGALDVTKTIADRVGVSSKVRVVDGTMVFMCIDVGEARASKVIGQFGKELIHAWALTVAAERGLWKVSGTFSSGPEWPAGTQYLDLPDGPTSGVSGKV